MTASPSAASAELCRENGGEHVTIFPKIECALGVENFDEILEASDGIMVARGDLGIEIKPELVPHIQKEIIAKCNAAYKPVITATQMLDSMQQNPRPTRAEVADVANAHLRTAPTPLCSLLSPLPGKYPVEAVKMQASIALETEKYLPAHAPLEVPADAHGTRVVNNVVGMSAVNMATTVGAKCITVPTTTGRTRSPDLALPSQHADLRVLSPRVGRPADDHVLGRYPAPGRDYPGHRQRHDRQGDRDR